MMICVKIKYLTKDECKRRKKTALANLCSILCLIFLFFSSFNAYSQDDQSFGLTFNHNALLVSDIDTSGKFYQEILGLEKITNRTKKEGRLWLSMGMGTELHLILGEGKDLNRQKAIHFALTARDFDSFIENIQEKDIPFSSWEGEDSKVTIRADGIRQIYVQDPDGYWIEVNSQE